MPPEGRGNIKDGKSTNKRFPPDKFAVVVRKIKNVRHIDEKGKAVLAKGLSIHHTFPSGQLRIIDGSPYGRGIKWLEGDTPDE